MPLATTLTVGGSVSAMSPDGAPVTWIATSGNGRVPVSATTVTPTVASVGWRSDTPVGSRSGTRNDRLVLSPVTSIGVVSTRSTPATVSGAPCTWTAMGSVVIREIQ